MSDGWIRIFTAPDPVVGGMAEELLRDAGIPVMLRSDDFLGIGGHASHPEILCSPEDVPTARDLLQEKGFLGGSVSLEEILERERDGIITETVHHIRRLVTSYRQVPEDELRKGTAEAFDAARELILNEDFRRITLFLDSLLRQRAAEGIVSGDVVRAVTIFKDVLVGRILFLEDCSQEETSRLLERLEKLRDAIETRLASLSQRYSGVDRMRLLSVGLSALPLPVMILRTGDCRIEWLNDAMKKVTGAMEGEDAFKALTAVLNGLDLETVEADVLTRGETAPLPLPDGGFLLVNRLALEDGDHHWSVLVLSGGNGMDV